MSSLGTLINGSSNIVNRDIIKDVNKPVTNTDYFDIVITDLKPNTSYNVQFAWVYPDDTRSDYSATYTFTTDLESAPAIPSTPSVTAGPGLINVAWNGNNSSGGALINYAKVNVYVNGVLRDFFLAAGTKSIALAKGTYSITLRSASATDAISDPSTAASATVTTDATDAAAAQSSANSALAQLLTKLNDSAAVITDVNNNITAINSNGITLFATGSEQTTTTATATSAPTSGARMVMNYAGIAAYDSTSSNNTTGVTFSLNAANGDAFFKGTIGASTINAAINMTAGNSLTVGPSTGTNISNVAIKSTSSSTSLLEFIYINSAGNIFEKNTIRASAFGLILAVAEDASGNVKNAITLYGNNSESATKNRIINSLPTKYSGNYSDWGSSSELNLTGGLGYFRNMLFNTTDPGAGSSASSYVPGSVYLVYEN